MRGTKALLLAGATFGLTSAAFAADMPVKAPMIPPALYNWTGFYAGVHAGYGGGMKDWSGINYPAGGAFGGVQVGYNQQVGNVVFGPEGDISWAGIRGSVDELIAIPFSVSSFTARLTTKIDGIATVGGRLGLAVDRFYVYGKAGLAWAHEVHTESQLSTITGVPARSRPFSPAMKSRRGRWSASASNTLCPATGRSRRNTTTSISLPTTRSPCP